MFISLDYYLQNNRRKGAKNPCDGLCKCYSIRKMMQKNSFS